MRSVRPWVRALHRDLGYLAVGLTVVYAASGLAVNHLDQWDPNFTRREASYTVPLPLPADEAEAGRAVARAVTGGLGGEPDSALLVEPTRLEVTLGERTLVADPTTGRVTEEVQEPRFLLRAANWLHLNRGKRAWTYVADAYAAGLLLLALSGLFMIPGRKGLLGRGAVLALVGAAVPVVYVVASGGP